MANRNLLIVFGGTEEGGSDYNRLQEAFSQAQLDAQNTDVIQFNFLFGKPKTILPPSPIVAYRAAGSGNPREMLTRDVTFEIPGIFPFPATQGPDVYAVDNTVLPGVSSQLSAIENFVKQTNWTLVGLKNSSTSGMQFGVHQGFADRAYDLVAKFLADNPGVYDNISTIGHSRGVSLTARFSGKFQDDARFKRAVLLDPVSKNNDDDAIVGDARDAVQQLSRKGKEVHIVSKTKDSGFDYEAYIAELVGTKYYHLPTSKTAGLLLKANPESRINTSLGNEPDMRNVFVHQALMQHGYMLQKATGFENGKPFTGLPTNFGAYQRIIDPAPWTGTYYNGEEINIDQVAQSAWLTGYVRGLHSADRESTITQKFNPLGLLGGPLFTPVVTHHKLPDSDPLSKYYNAFEIDDNQNQRDRRHAFVHALAYKTLIPTIELSINRTESLEGREAEVTITATSNRVFNTPQQVQLRLDIDPSSPLRTTANLASDFDYDGFAQKIIIPPNEKSATFSFKVKDDGLVESDERITFEIFSVLHDTPLVPGGVQGLIKPGKKSATFTIKDDDVAGLKIQKSNAFTEVVEGGKTDTYTVALTSEPSATTTVTLTPDAQVTTAPATLTFNSSNWKTPQTVTVTAVTGDGLEALNHTGTITHTTTGGPDYTGLAPVPVTVKVIDDQVVNIELEESGGATQIWESENVSGGVMESGPRGIADSYTLKLNQAPAAGETVTISFTTDSQLAAIAPLTFNQSNWSTPQTVSVKAINDQDLEDFFHTGLITHVVSSSDSASPFNNAPLRDVNVTIQDDDTPTVTIVESGGSTEVSEDGKTDTYTLVLDSKPRNDVKIEFDTDVQLEEIAAVTFTPANWDQPQEVTVKAVDDGDFEDLIHDSEIFHFVSSDDPDYDDVLIPDVTVKIDENDILTPPPPSVVPPVAPETKPRLVVTDLPPGVTPNNGAPGSEEQPITVPDGQPEPLILQAKSTKDAVRTLRLDNPGDAPLVLDRLTFAPGLTNFPPGLTGDDIFIFSLSQNPIPPGGKADLVIRLRDDLPPGEYAGIFSALTNLPGTDAVYNFPLRATVSLPLAREVAEANAVPAIDPFPETAGDDEIFGAFFDEDGPQWLNGSLGDDLINGNVGNDVLTGGPGNDVVHGGQGNDFIRGALGDDVLFGDLGNDTLIGGLGRDRFVLGAGDGSDLILDFTVDADAFLLKPELTFEQLTFVAAGNSTRIESNGELLATVVGVPTPIVSAASFGPLT